MFHFESFTPLATLAACGALAACAPLPIEVPADGAGVGAAAASALRAACAPLLKALVLARGQAQVRQYLVDAGMAPLSAEPLAFRVGDVVHETEDGVLVAQHLLPGHDPLVTALRAEIDEGTAACRTEGAATFLGAAVTRVSFRHPQVHPRYNPTTVLIDDATGLPAHHSYAGMPDQGFAWVYGSGPLNTHAAVAAQVARRAKASAAGSP